MHRWTAFSNAASSEWRMGVLLVLILVRVRAMDSSVLLVVAVVVVLSLGVLTRRWVFRSTLAMRRLGVKLRAFRCDNDEEEVVGLDLARIAAVAAPTVLLEHSTQHDTTTFLHSSLASTHLLQLQHCLRGTAPTLDSSENSPHPIDPKFSRQTNEIDSTPGCLDPLVTVLYWSSTKTCCCFCCSSNKSVTRSSFLLLSIIRLLFLLLYCMRRLLWRMRCFCWSRSFRK
jgi:hypothetical protein